MPQDQLDIARGQLRTARLAEASTGASARHVVGGAGLPDVSTASVKLLTQKRARAASTRRRTGGWTWGVVVAAHLVAWVVLAQAGRLRPSATSDFFAEALFASTTVFVVLAVISVVTRGILPVLIGADGRFSTSYLQAYLWTIVLVWAFFFFIWVSAFGGAADLAEVTNGLSVEYLVLLGGPFAALIAAKQIYATKAADGDVQKVNTVQTSLKDVLVDDRGRADLVDVQYLLFNFVALAYFFVSFAHDSAKLPSLPEGLVALTSTSALAYVGKKAVDKSRPVISNVVLAEGTGTPSVGDVVRIRGLNFVPAGAEGEEYLRMVSVLFDAVKTPVAPAGPDPARPGQPQALADANVTATEILVAVPPLELTALRSVRVVVVTAAGVETEAYPLFLAPKTIDARFPDEITSGKPLSVAVLNLPAGTPVEVEIGGAVQDTTLLPDGTVTVVAPAGLTGTQAVIVRAPGCAELKRLMTVA